MIAPTRRGLLGGAAVLATVPPIADTPAPHPDAELLAACAEFDRLERAYVATFPKDRELTEPEEEAAQEKRALLQRAQKPLADLMVSIRARTVEGQQARAHSLVLWEGHDLSGDVSSEYVNIRLLGAVLRDLTEGGGCRNMTTATNSPTASLERARRALYDAGVIGAILQSLGNAEISGDRPIEGTSIAWLGEQLDNALNRVEEALNPQA